MQKLPRENCHFGRNLASRIKGRVKLSFKRISGGANKLNFVGRGNKEIPFLVCFETHSPLYRERVVA